MTQTLGIRREDKNIWEKRVPLTPDHVRELVRQNINVRIQPSDLRIFSDDDYRDAGADVTEDIYQSNLVLGVKEIPPVYFTKNGNYLFFSHTIKAQPYNMPMLKRLLDVGGTLLDYEKVTDNNGKRLIFFGRYAGVVGAVETLRGLGLRWQSKGIETPLVDLKQPNTVRDLDELKQVVGEVGRSIKNNGLPSSIAPVIIGFTGNGAVSKGAQEICEKLPHERIDTKKLNELVSQPENARTDCVYLLVLEEEQLYATKDPAMEFSRQGYYEHPENYRSLFFEDYASKLTAVVNGIYWEEKYPRLLTKENFESMLGQRNNRLEIVGDVSCDIDGSMACTVQASNIDEPVFLYHPEIGFAGHDLSADGFAVMSVDNLPCELSRDASRTFGDALTPFLPKLLASHFRAEDMPEEFLAAMIAHKGQLTPDYQWLSEHLPK